MNGNLNNTKVCPNCGITNLANAKFCIKCGGNLEENNNMNNNMNNNSNNNDVNNQFQNNMNMNNIFNNSDNMNSNFNNNISNNQILGGKLDYIKYLFGSFLKPFDTYKNNESTLGDFKNSSILALIVVGIMTVISLLSTMLSAVRHKSYFSGKVTWNWDNLGDVEFAILETSGQISVVQKPEKRALKPEDFNINAKYEGIAYDLVIDGKIMEENLKKLGKNRKWLETEVGKFNMKPEEALVVVLNGDNTMFCQKKEET